MSHYLIDASAEKTLHIGKQGENLATRIDFGAFAAECRAQYGAGTMVIAHERAEDGAPYAIMPTDGRYWDVLSSDLQHPGTGWLEVTYVVGAVVKKSLRWKTVTLSALGETVDPPEAWKSYIERVTALVDGVYNMGVTAHESATPTVAKSVDAGGRVQLDFGIVKGEKGDPGPAGPRGEKGEKGDPGSGGDVTREAVVDALGYTPADDEDVGALKADLTALDAATVKSVNNTLPDANGNVNVQGGGAVNDVQVDGTSILVDGVANVPIGGADTLGVFKISTSFGIAVNSSGILTLYAAPARNIDGTRGTTFDKYLPITVSNLDYAVKAAMCDGKGAAWTADEQAAAQQRLGILSVEGVYF